MICCFWLPIIHRINCPSPRLLVHLFILDPDSILSFHRFCFFPTYFMFCHRILGRLCSFSLVQNDSTTFWQNTFDCLFLLNLFNNSFSLLYYCCCIEWSINIYEMKIKFAYYSRVLALYGSRRLCWSFPPSYPFHFCHLWSILPVLIVIEIIAFWKDLLN